MTKIQLDKIDRETMYIDWFIDEETGGLSAYLCDAKGNKIKLPKPED